MKTFSITLDDQVDAALEATSARLGREKALVVADLVRKFVQAEPPPDKLRDPQLIRLYQQLAAQYLALAEAGMTEYQQQLRAEEPYER